MRVLFATSEIHPLMKTGGLADVSASLPHALHALGVDIRAVMPAYADTLKRLKSWQVIIQGGGLQLSVNPDQGGVVRSRQKVVVQSCVRNLELHAHLTGFRQAAISIVSYFTAIFGNSHPMPFCDPDQGGHMLPFRNDNLSER